MTKNKPTQKANADEQNELTAPKDPTFNVQTPMGEFSVDMKAYADAKAAAYEMMPKQKQSVSFWKQIQSVKVHLSQKVAVSLNLNGQRNACNNGSMHLISHSRPIGVPTLMNVRH